MLIKHEYKFFGGNSLWMERHVLDIKRAPLYAEPLKVVLYYFSSNKQVKGLKSDASVRFAFGGCCCKSKTCSQKIINRKQNKASPRLQEQSKYPLTIKTQISTRCKSFVCLKKKSNFVKISQKIHPSSWNSFHLTNESMTNLFQHNRKTTVQRPVETSHSLTNSNHSWPPVTQCH